MLEVYMPAGRLQSKNAGRLSGRAILVMDSSRREAQAEGRIY